MLAGGANSHNSERTQANCRCTKGDAGSKTKRSYFMSFTVGGAPRKHPQLSLPLPHTGKWQFSHSSVG
eukprot:1829442-Karenia_brevis.AAC.1